MINLLIILAGIIIGTFAVIVFRKIRQIFISVKIKKIKKNREAEIQNTRKQSLPGFFVSETIKGIDQEYQSKIKKLQKDIK